MCGILTIIDNEKVLSKGPSFEQLLELIKHRGPDHADYLEIDGLYLGHTRLSIIDLKGGDQPLVKDNKILLFNGEIYNYQTLKEELEREGISFSTKSDTEVLLECYNKYGYNFIEHLDGMFAFVIYDKLKEHLVFGRDKLGIKPLYFYQGEKHKVIASEMHPINALLPNLVSIKHSYIKEYLEKGYSFEKLYNDQKIINKGTVYTYDIETGEIDERFKLKLLKNTKNGITANSLKSLLEQEIESQLHADVDVGVLLSGGIDSSIITAIASNYRESINTYSITFDKSEFSESYYSQLVANKFKTNHKEFEFDEEKLLEYIPRMIECIDVPLYDPAMLPLMYLCDNVSKYQKVVLSGDGGDELFAGYTHLRILRYKQLIKPVIPVLFLLKSQSAKLRHVYEIIQSNLSNMSVNEKYQQDFEILDNKLLRKTDLCSMYYGLEVRVPFLSERLLKYVQQYPPSNFMNLKYGKTPLRKLASQLVGKEIAYKKKQGFRIPLKKWVNGILYDEIKDDVSDSMIPRKILDKTQINSYLSKPEIYYENLFKIYVLNKWLKKNIE
ncbi:MAG: asparagine synthase (glutamine-hydrolyzing) [Gracilimonas sp.]|uniref:asparagine synthase (glutamine-hydrolyzing) n=1 Tax=Gracilimonas sp. TaxID=1974203 RepID=UPI001B13E30F|nr:asparagine synthase (glutamine-hydrolyzing) [Gracilimonas sp.]MBO6587225.1 asparagine synthase (glutamine-hydrolyzing) [Gracilimonas sp.]MBO6614287.1 asparagine synthase (glutamine-hydrolyzing) [Gracilimonas sp.]